MTDYPALAARMFDTPLLVDAAKAGVLARAFAPRIFGPAAATIDLRGAPEDQGNALRPRASILGDEIFARLQDRPGAGYSTVGGVAVIPVVGTLVRRGAWVGAYSGVTSYEGVSALVRAAAADPDVRAIALEIDTFGGEAQGVFELAADIRAAREAKPVTAFVSHYALSAGYAIAAQATEIVAPETAKAGSIGVVILHADHSAQLEREGVKVTLIHSGARKVDGNPFAPLPEEVRDEMQRESDLIWTRFASEVEEGRAGRITAADALRTEAAVFTARDAQARGLIDRVEELRPAFNRLVDVTPPARIVGCGSAGRSRHAAAAADFRPVPGVSGDPLLRALIEDTLNIVSPVAMAPADGSSGCITAAQAAQPKEAAIMQSKKAPDADTPKAETETVAETVQEQRPAADIGATERATKILAKCEKAGLTMAFARQMIESDLSLEAVYDKIIDEKAARAQDGGDIVNAVASTAITGDAVDRTRQGITLSLLNRTGLDGGERNEFSGMSMKELARETLRARGLTPPRGGSMELVAAAFVPSMAGAMHSTSDFGDILADVANKAMLKGFEETPETFERFTSIGTMSDYKPHKKVGLDAFPSLLKVEEGAEFQYGSIGDYGELAVLATYGRMFAVTRQAVINDDLDAMTRVPAKMGRAARRTVGDLVFAVLTGNPTMSDGTALFHADHGNLATAAGAPSEATINAGITAMARQKDRSANATALNITPRFLIAAPEQRSAVLQALNSEYAPDDTEKAGSSKMSRAYNTVRDAAEPIFDARLPTGAWYLAADPMAFDTIEVGYLDGVSTPFIEQQEGWRVDGTEFKVRLVATATPLAWEGLYKNAGS